MAFQLASECRGFRETNPLQQCPFAAVEGIFSRPEGRDSGRRTWSVLVLYWIGADPLELIIHKVFVTQEQWVDETTFNDLLALGNALPGPAFSQLAFSISALRGGVLAAILSFILLT